MQMDIRPASSLLRTDLFQTRLREETTSIYANYTNTPPDPRIDAVILDEFYAARGYFGIVWNYVIKTSGAVEIARNPLTIAAKPIIYNQVCISIGVVGGRDPEKYELAHTVTPEQEQALEVLYQSITDALGTPLEVEDRVAVRAARKADRERLLEERRLEREAEDLAEFEGELRDEFERSQA